MLEQFEEMLDEAINDLSEAECKKLFKKMIERLKELID